MQPGVSWKHNAMVMVVFFRDGPHLQVHLVQDVIIVQSLMIGCFWKRAVQECLKFGAFFLIDSPWLWGFTETRTIAKLTAEDTYNKVTVQAHLTCVWPCLILDWTNIAPPMSAGNN